MKQSRGARVEGDVLLPLALAGGAVLGAVLDMKATSALWGPAQLTLAQFLITAIHWHATRVWHTRKALFHPLLWHWSAALFGGAILGALMGAISLAWHLGQSSGWAQRLLGAGGEASAKRSANPAKWLPFAPEKFASFTPAAVVARDRVRPSLTATAKRQRRLDDYGFVIGYAANKRRYPIAISSELSVLVAGEPRSGKTAGFVIPWVARWQGPVVNTSTRNEVLRATLVARKRVSKQIHVLTLPGIDIPEGVDPISYDICWFYDDELDALIEAAERRASVFSEVASDKGQPIWENATKQIFACLLLIGFAWRRAQMHFLGEDDASAKPSLDSIDPKTNHIDVLKHFATLEWTRTPEGVAAVRTFLAANIPAGKGAYVASYVASVVRTFSGGSGTTEFAQTVAGMIAVGLGKLNDPQVAAVFSTPWDKPLFDPEEFLATSGTLYLISRSEDSRDLAKFFSLVVNEVAAAARRRAARLGRCDPGLALILDEIANIAPLPNLKSYMSEGGGNGITTVAVVQNLRQLVSVYGQERADEITSSANVLAAFGGSKAKEDLAMYAELAGSRTVQMSSFDRRGNVTGRSESTQAALDANQIGNMPEGWVYLKLPGCDPIIAKTVYYWCRPSSWAWRREWGPGFAPDIASYPFHGTRRALSWRALYDLALESDRVPMVRFAVEIETESGDASRGTKAGEEAAVEPSQSSPGPAQKLYAGRDPAMSIVARRERIAEERRRRAEQEGLAWDTDADGLERFFTSIPRKDSDGTA